MAAATVLIAAVLASGCANEQPPAPPPPQKAVARPAPPQAAAPGKSDASADAGKEKTAFTYNPAGRRDPFMPLIVRDVKREKRADLPPLQRHSIDEFKLTGVIWGGYGYRAMLEGPDGKGYFIHPGTIIGPNRGVVKKITANGLVIEEKFKTYTGELQRKEIVIELRKKREDM